MTAQSPGLFLVLVFAVVCPLLARAQERPNDPAVSSTDASLQTSENEKITETKGDIPAKRELRDKAANSDNSLGQGFVKSILVDQRAIWTSPDRIRLHDTTWLVPLGGLTAGLLVTDSDVARHLSNSPNRLDTSRKLSDVGAASLIGAAGGLYLWGKTTRDDHKREAGLLSGEALINSLLFSQAMKFSTRRERPREDNARGSFGQGGSSFPSDHAVAAWSVASVIAHEYPGPLTQLLAYGLASVVSASRVTAKEHFPSDVLVGSAIGWLVGQQVYRAHHNPELGGGSWATLSEATYAESPRKPGNMGSPYVSLDSWIYPALERLAALGYVQTAFLGMRPWTRLECARLVDEAADRFREEAGDPTEPTRLYRALEKEFAPDLALLGGGRNRAARLESIYTRFTEISGKPLTDSYHFGQTIINDFGRPYQEGFNNTTGFSTWATAGPFAVHVRGEYQHAPSAPGFSQAVQNLTAAVDDNPVQRAIPIPETNQFRLLDTYVATDFENWNFAFGKQSLWWGLGEGGALLFSDNAEPIYMFRASRITPFTLPWILHWLGPTKIDTFFGKLSGNQFPPGPVIHGETISFKPTPNLELGFVRMAEMGGAGRPITPAAIFNSYVSPRESAFFAANENPGKRTSGFELSYRVPFLRDWLTVYTDSISPDDVSPVSAPRRAAINPGIYLTHFPKLPRLDLRVEAVNTDTPSSSIDGHFVYYDFFYHDLSTNKKNLIGSWVGREGQGVQAWSSYWLSPQSRIQLGYRHWRVDSDFIPQGGTVNDMAVRTDVWLRPDLSASGSVQYELWKFPVLAAGQQANVTGSFQLTFWPHWQKN